MATFSGSVFQSALLRRKRRIRSASERVVRTGERNRPAPVLRRSCDSGLTAADVGSARTFFVLIAVFSILAHTGHGANHANMAIANW